MRVSALLALAILAPGCTVDGGPGGAGADAGVPSPADSDGGKDDPGDEALYEEPARIEALSSPGFQDDDPTLTGDLLELYFDSDRLGGLGGHDIWRARRDSPSSPWEAPRPVPNLSSEFEESAPEVSADGLSMWFSSDRPGGQGGYDIYLSTRDARDQRWSEPEPVASLNSEFAELSASVDATGQIVVFYSDRAGGDNDLFFATRAAATDPWEKPEFLSELNTDRSEADPYLAESGLVIYFAAGTEQDLDIYRSTRPDLGATFGIPHALAEINSEYHDADPWLSPDGRYMLLTSRRSGDNEIYEARRIAD